MQKTTQEVGKAPATKNNNSATVKANELETAAKANQSDAYVQ